MRMAILGSTDALQFYLEHQGTVGWNGTWALVTVSTTLKHCSEYRELPVRKKTIFLSKSTVKVKMNLKENTQVW